MKTRFNPFIIFAFLFLQCALVLSQNESDISKIIIGKNYKIVLFDDTEIKGRIVASDSVEVRVETENKSTIIVPKSNILYYTSDLQKDKYSFSVSLMGGISFLTNDFYPYYGDSKGKSGLNLNASSILFLSETKGLKFDVGYTYVKSRDWTYYSASNSPYYDSYYTGGSVSMLSFKGNILFGRFNPSERFMFYFSLGFGMHFTNQDSRTESYYSRNYPDTSYTLLTNTYQPVSEVNALISLGGSVGYRFSKRFGASIEMEYDMVTAESIFIFWGGRNYFPLRAGIFYIF